MVALFARAAGVVCRMGLARNLSPLFRAGGMAPTKADHPGSRLAKGPRRTTPGYFPTRWHHALGYMPGANLGIGEKKERRSLRQRAQFSRAAPCRVIFEEKLAPCSHRMRLDL